MARLTASIRGRSATSAAESAASEGVSGMADRADMRTPPGRDVTCVGEAVTCITHADTTTARTPETPHCRATGNPALGGSAGRVRGTVGPVRLCRVSCYVALHEHDQQASDRRRPCR